MARNFWIKSEIDALQAWHHAHGYEVFDVSDFRTAIGEVAQGVKGDFARFGQKPIVIEKVRGEQYHVILQLIPADVTAVKEPVQEQPTPRFKRRHKEEEEEGGRDGNR
jgi:hypothetical protein